MSGHPPAAWKSHCFVVRHHGRARRVEVYSPVPRASTLWALGRNNDEDVEEQQLWPPDAAFRALTARQRPSHREVEMFYRELGRVLSGRKVDFKTALSLVAPLAETPVFRGIIAGLYHYREEIAERAELFSRFPQAFGPADIAQIRKGAASGSEGEVFIQLAEELHERDVLMKKIYTALFMPAVVLASTMAALVALNLFVLPKMAESFRSLNYQLPLATRIVIWLNQAVFTNPVFLVSGPLLAAWIFGQRGRIGGSRWFQRAWIRTPCLGPLYRKTVLARCLRTLAQLYRARLPQREAFAIAADVANNHEIKAFFQAISARLSAGIRLHEAFLAERHQLGDEGQYLAARLRISQPTGDEAGILWEISELYKQDTIFAADTLPQLIEPAAYAFIGGILLLLVLAITLPDLDFAYHAMKESLQYGTAAGSAP